MAQEDRRSFSWNLGFVEREEAGDGKTAPRRVEGAVLDTLTVLQAVQLLARGRVPDVRVSILGSAAD